MRNFDEERAAYPALTFVLAGREWHVRREVKPEALLAYENLTGDAELPESMKVLDDLIVSCLVQSERDAWFAQRMNDGEDDALGLSTISAIALYLIESVVARPTESPSRSPAGARGRKTGTSSTGASSSLAAVEPPS